MNRAQRVAQVLREHPNMAFSVNELLRALKEPTANQKFFSSTLVRMLQRKEVTRVKGVDGVTGKDGVWTFTWAGTDAGAGAKADAGADAGTKRKSKKSTKGEDWTRAKTGPTEEERAHAEEEARKQKKHRRRPAAAPTQRDPWELFREITGCDATSFLKMQKAFRAAALEHHPDKGGDEAKFKELSGAWTTIKKQRSWGKS